MSQKDDLVYRQDVIDAIAAWTVEDRPDAEMPTDLVERIRGLLSAPTDWNEMEKKCEELKSHIDYLSRLNDRMKGEIKALKFAVRCNGVSGNEVRYEAD